ncbi:sigma 54-interacting transcriptional regulator [Enterovibrio sp. ZSDZ35]|uniref:Sigma 54-interacting transcriptional regulator n=1 Tax=Enterovibrio qingdaonensis TaxID=2899818 RepID=A0ABT5QNP0_9GAMM|nr:sigma 54-interacting transcriptional regulator [Enterovibrio sp. ZSDZ35]MDD1782602.1 sigma 54-interacting transcriptional regulator [Enterovibrio sp. ZSDZ35]
MVALHYGIAEARLEGVKSPGMIKDFIRVMTKIGHLPMGMEGVFVLFSHEFVSLSLRGNKDIKLEIEAHSLAVGSYWSPETLGLQDSESLRIGNLKSLSIQSVPVVDPESGVLGYVAYIHSDSEAVKTAELTLMVLTEYLIETGMGRRHRFEDEINKRFVEQSQACFLVIDNEHFITYASPEFYDQFNSSAQEIVNGNLFEYFLFPPKIKVQIHEGQVIDGENVDFDYSGNLKQLSVSVNALDNSHRVIRFLPIQSSRAKTDKNHRLVSTLDRFQTQSPAMQRVVNAAKESIKGTSPIYIMGEEGTGKRSLALTIHNSCERYREGPFIAVNLHSVKKEDLSTLLLGNEEEGSKSKFEMANGGTLYIERIDLLPGVLQAALTHIILTKTLFDINTNKSISLNFRLITSSIKPLEDLVHERRFCPSLYYYLTGASLILPNLQHRMEDIPMFVDRKLGDLYGGREDIDENLRQLLVEHAANRTWIGNISELAKWIEHTFLHRDSVLLDASAVDAMAVVATPIQPLDDIEKREIANALAVLNRKYIDVADQLGISLSTLRRKIAKYDL